MLGWNISVFRQADGGSSPARTDSECAARLAVWQAGLEGLLWVDELVKVGHAIDLGGDGYPFHYTAQAKHLIPQVVSGPPESRSSWGLGEHDVITSEWEGKTAIDRATTDACQPDEWLLVVAWDES